MGANHADMVSCIASQHLYKGQVTVKAHIAIVPELENEESVVCMCPQCKVAGLCTYTN